jgi:hypothetical protein
MSYVNNIPTIEDPGLNIEEKKKFTSAFVGSNNNTNNSEPFTDMFYPIMNYVDDDVLTNDVIGVVSVTFYWRDMLKYFLADKVDGMHVVVENSCNQTFTYISSGSEPKYLGDGDLHETGFEDRSLSFKLPEDIFSSDGCQYTIHTYPSSDMFFDFTKTQPK